VKNEVGAPSSGKGDECKARCGPTKSMNEFTKEKNNVGEEVFQPGGWY